MQVLAFKGLKKKKKNKTTLQFGGKRPLPPRSNTERPTSPVKLYSVMSTLHSCCCMIVAAMPMIPLTLNLSSKDGYQMSIEK